MTMSNTYDILLSSYGGEPDDMDGEKKKTSDAKYRWMQENSKTFQVRVMKRTESDIWEYLQDKKPAPIFKAALREYMVNHPDE